MVMWKETVPKCRTRCRPAAMATLILLCAPLVAPAYIDAGGWQVTLPEIISEFRTITLLEVDRVNLPRGGFKFRAGRPLKGMPAFKDLRLQMEWGDAGAPFKELGAGRVAVHFTQSCEPRFVAAPSSPAFENLLAHRACLTFIDGTWFHTMPGAEGWQSGTVRRDFEMAFTGTSTELAEAVSRLLRGHEVIVQSRRLRNPSEIQWVRYSMDAPNYKAIARDPSAPPADRRPVLAWVSELREGRSAVRVQAALALAELGPAAREAGPALGTALRDPDPEVRSAAVFALGACTPDTAGTIEGLARALSDEDWFVRLGAARALENFGSRAAPALPALVRALQPNDLIKDFRPVRCGAVMVAISKIDPRSRELEPAFKMVIGKLLEDEHQGSFGARATGARLLGDCGPAAQSTVPALVKLLQDPQGDVRIAAAEALLKIAPAREGEPALEVLARALGCPEPLVRVRAGEILGRLGPKSRRALPALRAALQDPEPEVQRAAAQAVHDLLASGRE